MNGVRAAVPAARLGAALAVRALETRADRDRYDREFVAELYGLPAGAQLRSTAGFLSQAFALRAALDARTRPGEVPMSATNHAWQACAVCHREWSRGIPPVYGGV